MPEGNNTQNHGSGAGSPVSDCSAWNEVVDALEEWGQHFLETKNPAALVVLRAKTMIQDQAARIGELLDALRNVRDHRDALKKASASYIYDAEDFSSKSEKLRDLIKAKSFSPNKKEHSTPKRS